jgi:uncharacterized protein DUF4375
VNENEWLISLCESDRARFWTTPFGELTEPERTFVSIWTLEADVNNGGFDQYYLNSAGDHAHDAPRALRAIGAAAMAAVVEEANAVFGDDGPPADRDARLRALDALGPDAQERWNALDDRFYEYPDNLTACLYAYVQANRDQIQGVA